jgi:hypothetical protein
VLDFVILPKNFRRLHIWPEYVSRLHLSYKIKNLTTFFLIFYYFGSWTSSFYRKDFVTYFARISLSIKQRTWTPPPPPILHHKNIYMFTVYTGIFREYLSSRISRVFKFANFAIFFCHAKMSARKLLSSIHLLIDHYTPPWNLGPNTLGLDKIENMRTLIPAKISMFTVFVLYWQH